jgi:hypothetical protein
MPNWCSNTITIRGEKKEIDRLESFLNEKDGKEWFDFFLPCPQELKDGGPVGFSTEPPAEKEQSLVEKYGSTNWYDWSVQNWGTKWNCDAQDWSREDDSISFWFDSAWGPPTELYSFICNDTDFDVEAGYHEEGMAFVGRFVDGEDESYAYSDVASLLDIPEVIVSDWNLLEMLEERAEWEEDDDFDDEEEENENGKSN